MLSPAIGLPVVCVGLLAQATGLRAAAVALGCVVALLATACGTSLVARERRRVSRAAS